MNDDRDLAGPDSDCPQAAMAGHCVLARPDRRRWFAGAGAWAGILTTGLLANCRDAGSSETGRPAGAAARGPDPGAAPGVVRGGGYDGSIAVAGGDFINGHGMATQLRGADTEGYVSASINNVNQGAGGDVAGGNFDQPHGGPILSALKAWKMNVIRIGINEASWLGYTCFRTDGTAVNPDPHGVYRSQITRQIAALNGIGCYVILVLGWTNPGRAAPFGQDFMANQDNSIACWDSLARCYGYPHGTELKRNGGTVDDRSVIFELFNEPEPYGDSATAWKLIMEGGFYRNCYAYNNPFTPIYPFPCGAASGTFTPGEPVDIDGGISGRVLCHFANATRGYPASGTQFIHLFGLSGTSVRAGATVTGRASRATTTITSAEFGWHVAGHAQLLAAVRAAGAWNVCLLSGIDYAKDLGRWADYAPADTVPPAGYDGPGWRPQIGACWHPYPAWSSISRATAASGGRDYALGDTILLPMPESGPAANSVYWQAQLQVTGVDGGAITGVKINAYTGGTPGRPSADGAGNYSASNMVGGAYCNLLLPVNPVPQESSSGRGSGATFNLTFRNHDGDSGTGDWPNYDTWVQVARLKKTFNGIGVPVCITETGEHTGTGISGSPWMAALTAWCDDNGVSLVCFCYNPSAGWYRDTGWDLALATVDHKPTPGYGEFMYNWFTRHPA